jgi:FkbM family methyltransferase
MPAWMRGSALEAPARRFAQWVKSGSLRAERSLRRGRSRCKLPSVEERVWLDFDFAVGYPLPREDPLLAALLADLKPGQTFYDVGSFVGWYAIAASRRLGGGRVVAFEPVPETARLLRRHCTLNQVEDRVRVVEAACSNAAGMVSMPVWPTMATTWASGNALRNVYPQEAAQPAWVPVCTVRLDDFVRAGGPPPDVIKIDVEGAELWTLQGAEEVLRTARPRVFLELHAFAWRLFDTTETRFRSFLGDVGYELRDLAPPHDRVGSIPEYGHALLRPAS